MTTLKNAFRNVSRAKGRSILIGIIIVIIAFSVCIGLCIRQSAADAREDALAEMNITAQISPDRGSAMEKSRDDKGSFDPSQLSEKIKSSLTLDEMLTYAEADSVKTFYYTMTASVDAGDDLEAYSTSSDDDESSSDSESSSSNSDSESSKRPGSMGSSSDFTITGYSSDDAMTDFVDGTCTISDGSVFDEGTSKKVCIISDELATYNDLEVGDSIQLVSPDDEDETFKLKIVGIYTNSQSSAQAGGMGGMSRMMGGVDPANEIYTSYETLAAIAEANESISTSISGTYVLGDLEAYESFCAEVTELGLSDDYVVSSSDLTEYEQQAQPLENLAKYAGYFLIVILLIGAAILIVLNMFATRERKYEIGVLTAIGMKKGKVAKLFMTEILIITLAGVIIGGAIGAATSVPVTNALLASQIESQQESLQDKNDAFGRDFGGMQGGQPPEMSEKSQSSDSQSSEDLSSLDSSDSSSVPEKPDGESKKGMGKVGEYITDVSASVNLVVLLELLAICIVLAMVSGVASVTAIMRYEPLQILSNRD